MAPKSIYREAWLQKAIKALAPLFAEQGVALPPKVQVSVGFPGGGSARKRIGECWATRACGDQVPHIFISPTLEQPVIVLATLTHELIHAVDDCKSGHAGAFRKMAVSVGLEGKMTATVPGDALIERLKEVSEKLGEYPHKAVTLGENAKKQTTRMRKFECEECGYTGRTTAKWLDTYGAPLCPCNGEQMTF